MTRNRKLRDDLRTAAAKPAQENQTEDDLEQDDPLAALSGDAVEPQEEEIEDLYATQDDPQPAPKAEPEEDPLAALQKQFDEIKAQKQAAEDRLKERDTQEAQYRAAIERERSERAAVEAQYRDEQRRRAEVEKESLVQHKAVIEHAIAASKADIDFAKRAYTEAMSNMDYAAAAEAQEKLAEAKFQVSKLADGYEKIQEQIDAPAPVVEQRAAPRREVQQPQPAPQVDPWDAAIANYSPRDRDWLKAHKQDLFNNPQRQQLAQAADITATTKHSLQRGTDEYYSFLDEFMGYAEPEATAATPPPAATRQAPAKRAPIVPAAPVSRSNMQDGGTALPYLTRDQKETALALGMSFAKYAKHMQDIQAGRTHLKFMHEGN